MDQLDFFGEPNIESKTKHRIARTSIAALDTVDLGRRQLEVLDAIAELHRRDDAPSDQDLARHLDWSINRITPRRGELVDKGLVVQGATKLGETGRLVATWRPAP